MTYMFHSGTQPPQGVVAPPGPRRLIWVPEWNMYVMEGHDVVYYGGAYYYFQNGHWWTSPSYGGPWVTIVTPPPAIAQLPPGQLHSHLPGRSFCPPGQAKKG